MADIMNIKILDDGTIQVSTDKISQKNHASADDFLEELESMLGGTRTTKEKEGVAHVHHHHHGHHGHHHHKKQNS